MTVDKVLEEALINVTEDAAIAAAQTMGRGDRKESDRVAVEAMRSALGLIDINGRVVIGEGERDQAPMLYVGEEVGSRPGDAAARAIDIAVDPLEGTNLCATGDSGAIAVLAAAERGGLLHAPDIYMNKLVVGATARGRVHIDAPVAENLRAIAEALDREISDLTVVVLDRERHRELIEDIRAAGSRIRLIRDGDLSAGIAAAVRGTEVHAVMGIGGAPEGVLTAAAMRCLGGEIQARLTPLDDGQIQRAHKLGITNFDKIYGTDDLAPGDEILFSATGVTDGRLLRGVRFFGGGHRTSTLFMSKPRRNIRFVDSIHRDTIETPVLFR